MPIQTACPNCKTTFNMPDSAIGKNVRCKQCQQPFAVEAMAASAPSSGSSSGSPSKQRVASGSPSRPQPGSATPPPPLPPQQTGQAQAPRQARPAKSHRERQREQRRRRRGQATPFPGTSPDGTVQPYDAYAQDAPQSVNRQPHREVDERVLKKIDYLHRSAEVMAMTTLICLLLFGVLLIVAAIAGLNYAMDRKKLLADYDAGRIYIPEDETSPKDGGYYVDKIEYLREEKTVFLAPAIVLVFVIGCIGVIALVAN